MRTKLLELRYKCRCMSEETLCYVRTREPDEDIAGYMTHVQFCLGRDHAKKSPLCNSQQAEYMKMPVQNGRGIGDGIENA